jgi:hypothetical protein
VSKGLHWSIQKVIKYKKQLIGIGLLEKRARKHKANGTLAKSYVTVKYAAIRASDPSSLPAAMVGVAYPKNYRKYLRSPEWREISKAVKERDNNKCQECEATKKLHVHHTTYDHIFDEWDHMHELVTLCSDCHDIKHGIQKEAK